MPAPSPLAITGIACRFPGARNVEEFWQVIHSRDDQLRELDPQRWDVASFYSPDPEAPDCSVSRWAGMVADHDRFDAEFFAISPREAQRMDPQQRFALELAWHCLEDAHLDPLSLRGQAVGVFMGVCPLDYKELQEGHSAGLDGHTITGTFSSLIPNRISYALDFHGPSLMVDTACSSSLVALHQAALALQSGSCEMALVGGVNILSTPTTFTTLSKLGALSPTGKLRAFSAGADGYVRGEGAGMLLLEPLAAAQRAGRRIHGILLGSAVNHGGGVRTLTSPSPFAQSRVIIEALSRADVPPSSISFIEAHGTGTPLGDPIEINGLRRAFSELYRRTGESPAAQAHCAIGSVKTQIGHLEAAAGVAGIIKVLLCMRQGELPALVNFTDTNPRIKLKSPFYLLTQAQAWPTSGATPRRAGVSSFGFGGANAHVVLESPPPTAPVSAPTDARPWQLLALSARSPAALQQLLQDYSACLAQHPWQAVCQGAALHRAALPWRRALVGNSPAELTQALQQAEPPEAPSSPPTVAFLFSGQGSQRVAMGAGLFQHETVFRDTLQRCAEILLEHLDRPLLALLFETDGDTLAQTGYSQPALFALEYALACQWRHWGVEPQYLLGHSVGELVAACVSGVFSLDDGLRLVAARGRLMQSLPRDGAMLAVAAPPEALEPFIAAHPETLSLAAYNTPTRVVLSGLRQRVEAARITLEAQGISCTPLTVSHAFHSPLLEPMLDEFRTVAASIDYRPGKIPVLSNLDGQPAGERHHDPDYWVQQARQAVNFVAGVATLHTQQVPLLIEIGPQPVLSGLARHSPGGEAFHTLASLPAQGDETRQLLQSLATAFEAGVDIDWRAFHGETAQPWVDLPLYPFQRQRHWLSLSEARRSHRGGHPLLGTRMDAPGLPQYQSHPGSGPSSYLLDHQVHGKPIFPAAAYLELALNAGGEASSGLAEVVFHRPLALPGVVLHTALHAGDQWQVHARPEDTDEWHCYASGRLTRAAPPPTLPTPPPCSSPPDYPAWAALGLHYGRAFQCLKGVTQQGDWWWGELATAQTEPYRLHPALLDGALQLLLMPLAEVAADTLYLPAALEQLSVYRSATTPLWVAARLLEGTETTQHAELCLLDPQGPVAWLQGLALKPMAAPQRPADIYHLRWQLSEASVSHRAGRWVVLGEDAFATTVAQQLGTTPQQDDINHVAATAQHLVFIAPPPPLDASQILNRLQHVVQSLIPLPSPPRLWVINRGAQPVDSTPVDPGSAALWGFVRSLGQECPALQAVLVDLDQDQPDALLTILKESPAAPELAWRDGQLLQPQLQPLVPVTEPYRLQLSEYGRLDALHPAPLERRPPGPGQVELRVTASGLNFRDVLYALGMLRELRDDPMAGVVAEQLPLGLECSAEVCQLGPGVNHLQPGDAVLAVLSRGSLASHVTVSADFVVPLPHHCDAIAAASLPLAYLTAYHGLVQLARLALGERVLIHAAGGGVGQAALQIAQRLGAEIHATAHPDKWPWLRQQGVKAVYHSREPEFLTALRQQTGGAGVDVVLNSLSGEFIPASLDALAPRGRFIEIGKLGIWTAAQVAARRADVDYHVFDLGEVGQQQPQLIQQHLHHLAQGLANQQIQPLSHRRVALQQAPEAFQTMARGQHRGKQLIVMPGSPLRLRSDACYLLTGASGGLGRHLAQWLIQRGARHLMLSGRRPAESLQPWLVELRDRGVNVDYQANDLSDTAAVSRLLQGAQALAPLDGIIHAAGILDDGPLGEQTPQRLQRVLRPKLAAWELHRQTQGQDLRLFLLLSSVVSLLGSAAQTNYAAANAFLDGLAHHRQQQGLKALSLNLGPLAGVGMAANLGEAQQQRLQARGWQPLAITELLERLDDLLQVDEAQAMLASVDWSRWQAQAARPSVLVEALVEHSPDTQQPPDLQALSPGQRQQALEQRVREHLRGVLGLSAQHHVEARHRLFDLGLDSLTAVELRNRLQSDLDQPLRPTLLFDFPTVGALVEHLAGLYTTLAEPPPTTLTPQPRVDDQALDALSEAELAAMLARELGQDPNAP